MVLIDARSEVSDVIVTVYSWAQLIIKIQQGVNGEMVKT